MLVSRGQKSEDRSSTVLGTSGACVGMIEIGVKPSGSQIWSLLLFKAFRS
jgi:hypothetical protein